MIFLVSMRRHGSHAGGQEKKPVSLLGTKIYTYANAAENRVVVTINMNALASN